ncbi:hypothetical protein MNBD_GAMMA12-692 [hydrothermal vent metagenome]|uniref:VWFA domain-containing protein n=1 Tax=hydrothermal vent metagenome TaxID=652676 RepID=A0A3B0ZLU5_9ZZZZ
MLLINRRVMCHLGLVVYLFFANSLFAANGKQNPAIAEKSKPLTIIIFAVTESASDVFDGISKRAVVHRELTDWQKNKVFASKASIVVLAQSGQKKCGVPNLVIGKNNYALKVIEKSRPVGQLSSWEMIKSIVKKYSNQKRPLNLVLISPGKNICDVDLCQKVATQKFTNVTTHVVGMALSHREKKLMQCLTSQTGGVFLNAKNISHLKLSLEDMHKRLLLHSKYNASLVSLNVSKPVKTGKTFKLIMTGHGNRFDRIVIRSVDRKVSYSYIYPFAQERVKQNPTKPLSKTSKRTLIMRAPLRVGEYRVSYLSVVDNKEIAVASLNVIKVVAKLDATLSATAGSKIRIEWTGPADRYDQIRIVAKSDPGKPLAYNYVRTSKNGVMFLHLPARPGVYEIHYLGKDDKVLANNVVVALPAKVTLESPETVVAGVPFQISWQAPVNQYDRIRILSIEKPDKSLAHIYAGSYPKSNATMIAPRQSGSYVLQYISSDKSILAHRVFRVTAAKVNLMTGTEVVAGQFLRVKWQGDISQYDQIQIVRNRQKSNMNQAKKKNNMSHDVLDSVNKAYARVYAGYSKKGVANLEVPEKAGAYEVIYITRDKVILARQPLSVLGASANINPLRPVSPGSKFKVAWQGPANRYDSIRITRKIKTRVPDSKSLVPNSSKPELSCAPQPKKLKSTAYAYVNMYANRVISFIAPLESGEYEVQYMTRHNKCLAMTRLLVKHKGL